FRSERYLPRVFLLQAAVRVEAATNSTYLEKNLRRESRAVGRVRREKPQVSHAVWSGLILLAMTRAHRGAHWIWPPSLSQLWLTALLRLAAMLVSNAAATAGMIGALLSRDWHTKAESAQLPQRTRNPMKEARRAEPNSQADPAPPTPATTTILAWWNR